MKKWIDNLRMERFLQDRAARMFPTLAEAFWGQLCMAIKDDLEDLEEAFPTLFPSEPQICQQPYSLSINYTAQYPHFLLCLSVNIPEQKLKMKQITTDASDARPQASDVVLELSLDRQQQEVQLYLDKMVLSCEEFSEMCLRPIVDLH